MTPYQSNKKLLKALGTLIKDRRKTLGYSQEEAADYLGISRHCFGRWERGLSPAIPFDQVLFLFDACEIDYDDLEKIYDDYRRGVYD